MRLARPIWGCTLLMASLTVQAAEYEEDAFFDPMPVVLTASRLPQTLADAPGAITVIDRRTIDAANYRDLPRYLRAVPGITIGYERSQSTWISYHGTGVSTPGVMQILVDGAAVDVPINFGALSWSSVPFFMSELDRIEVVRGASANTFGSTSLLGSANLITRTIPDVPTASVMTNIGDPDIRDVEVAWSGPIGGTKARIVAGEQRDDGFRDLHDTRRNRRLSITTVTPIDAANTLHLRLGTATEQAGLGYDDSPFGSNARRTSNDEHSMLHLRWEHAKDADTGWSLSAYHQYLNFEDNWTTGYSIFTDVPIVRDRQSNLTRLEFQRRSRPADDLRLVWGGRAQRGSIRSPAMFHLRRHLSDHEENIFTNLEWIIRPGVTLNMGLAAEDSGDGWRVNPRLFGNYTTASDTTWRLGASRVYRSPSSAVKYGEVQIYDRNFPGILLANPFLENPDLRETRADTVEAGMLARFNAGRTTIDARLFREVLKDQQIRVTVNDPVSLLGSQIPATQIQNADKSTTLTGLELQLNTHPWRGGSIQLAWSVIDRDAPTEAATAAIAPYTATLIWQQAWPARWSSYLSMTRVGPVAFGDSFLANGRYVVDDFTAVDLSLSRRFKAFGHPANFHLTALNLGPRHQEIADPAMQRVYGNRPANPVSRQVYAGVSLEF